MLLFYVLQKRYLNKICLLLQNPFNYFTWEFEVNAGSVTLA